MIALADIVDEIKTIFHCHNISISAWDPNESIISNVSNIVHEQYNKYIPVCDACIIDLIRILKGLDTNLSCALLDFLPLSKPTTLGLTRLCELMRGGGSKCLPVTLHSKVFKKLCMILSDHYSYPPHVSLNGDTKSFIQLPSLTLSCPKGYTLTTWFWFEELPCEQKCLYRCRTAQGEFEVLLSRTLNDESCTVVARTTFEKTQRSIRISHDVVGYAKLPLKKWFLFSLQHSSSLDIRCLNLLGSIDGVPFMESSLKYPFDTSPFESSWALGIGLRLSIASLALYSTVLSRDMMRMIFELGPEAVSLDQGVCVPQSSFDTGHTTLGVLLVKGELTEDFCKSSPLFMFSAHHFATDALIPHTTIGRNKAEHVEMSKRCINTDTSSVPVLHGSGHVSLDQSWKSVWLSINGTSVALYLLSDYCSLRADNSNKSDSYINDVDCCMDGCFELIGCLVLSSIDMRDKFIQEHGFHVIAQCLSRLDATCLSCKTIDLCVKLIQSFGVDSLEGDVITSALQGLLFNIRLWSISNRVTRTHLFAQVYHITSHTPQLLYRAIGTRKTLDVISAICKTSPFGESECNNYDTEIHDAGYRLLSLVIDGAIDYFDCDKFVQIPDIEYVVLALDDVYCSFASERILNLLEKFLISHPRSLYRTLCDTRFAETAGLRLLCDGTFTVKTRKIALMLTLWTLKENLGSVPEQINSLFGDLNRVRVDKEMAGATKSKKDVMARIRKLLQAVEKVWLTASMLSEKLYRSFGEGGWKDPDYANIAIGEFVWLLQSCGPLDCLHCCITLPFLFVFLSKIDLFRRQELLMSLAVGLKTNDSHVAVMSLLPDMSYIRQFLSFALVCPATDTHELSEYQWTSRICDVENAEESVSLLSTCYEISLDALSQIFLFKIRYLGSCAWETFKILASCLRYDYPHDIERKCLVRIFSMCFQKLARNKENWNLDMMECLSHMLSFVDDRMLCGSHRIPQDREYPELLDVSTSQSSLQGDDERQLLCFVMDVLNTLCRVADVVNFGTTDAKVLLCGIKIMSGCLLCVSDDIGNRLCNDLQVLLCFATEKWHYIQSDVFKDIVLSLLNKFRCAISNSGLSEFLRGRYSSAVVVIVDYFTRLPYSSTVVPPQTASLVDVLSVAENVHDAESIFMLLHIHLHAANSEAISFEEDEDVVAVSHQECPVDYLTPSMSDVADVVYPVSSNISDGDLINFEGDVQHPMSSAASTRDLVVIDAQSVSLSSAELLIDIAAVEQEEKLKNVFFQKWCEVRYGIIQDRVDSEDNRRSRTLEAVDFTVEATQRFWRTQRRKIEAELFYDEHVCEWKLGVAHEGYFPSRKRIVLRPRYDGEHSGDSKLGIVRDTRHESSMTETELRLALTRAAAGHTETNLIDDAFDDEGESRLASRPVSGWGVVDADGSEEGYGVVGLAHENVSESGDIELENEKIPNDLAGDIREIEEGVKCGRDVETGPCRSGTRRINSGPTIHEAEVMLVTASGNCVGTITFTSKDIFFSSSNDADMSHLDDPASVSLLSQRKVRRRRWTVSAICAIYLRKFRHRDSALEVFFHRGKHRNFFVDFGYMKNDVKRRDDFVKHLIQIAPRHSFKQWPGMSTYRLVSEHGVQERWLNGELSNFDYLMSLNTISGRTYNDLSQYPIMPWVIAQYTDPTIDLSNSRSFRDLSRPVGALNAERLKEFVNRYNTFSDPDIPPFMYGSHYSTMVGVVLHYLVRLQPFASLHKDVQNGRFDVSDRLFSSIPRTWEHNTSMLSEVKELTPEWFTLPDFLRNINGFDFGQMQDNSFVDDVELPPWAVTPEDFIRINREALESPYVSAHLHEWIDLIFGYKQRGPAAVEANNVFYFLTYSGSVNQDVLVDDTTRRALELQIAHFGQCPMQLFRNPHPMKRKTAVPRLLRQCFDLRSGGFVSPRSLDELLTLNCDCTLIYRINGQVVCNISLSNDKILCVLDNGVIESYCFGLSTTAKSFIAEQLRLTNTASKSHATSDGGDLISFVEGEQHDTPDGSFNGLLLSVDKDTPHFEYVPRISLPFRRNIGGASYVHISRSGRHIFAFGRLDGGIGVREVDVKSSAIVSAADFCAHRAPVCGLASDEIPGGATEVVVSCDILGRILVWTVSRIQKKFGQRCILSRRPQREFHCFEDINSWCDISWQLGIVVAGSCGLIHVFSIERNEKIRTIDVSNDLDRDRLALGRSYKLWNPNTGVIIKRGVLSDDGVIMNHIDMVNEQTTKQYLAAYTVNGQRVGIIEHATTATSLCCPARSAVVVSGHADGSVLLFDAYSLELLCEWLPHNTCKTVVFGGRKGLIRPEPLPSAIKHISVGPDAKRPSVIIATTMSGAVYVRALPDYIKWERTRSVSALSQLVAGPMQAVKGTLLQASDAAGLFANNAKSFAGETLAKMNKSKLFKNMGTMFGGMK